MNEPHTSPRAASSAVRDALTRGDIVALWALATVDLRAFVAHDLADLGPAAILAGAPTEPGWSAELGARWVEQLAEVWHGSAPDLELVDVVWHRPDLVAVEWAEPVPYAVTEDGCMVIRTVATTMVHGVDVDGIGWRLAGWNNRVADMSWPPHFDPLTTDWDRCHLRGEGPTG